MMHFRMLKLFSTSVKLQLHESSLRGLNKWSEKTPWTQQLPPTWSAASIGDAITGFLHWNWDSYSDKRLGPLKRGGAIPARYFMTYSGWGRKYISYQNTSTAWLFYDLILTIVGKHFTTMKFDKTDHIDGWVQDCLWELSALAMALSQSWIKQMIFQSVSEKEMWHISFLSTWYESGRWNPSWWKTRTYLS